MGTALSFLFVLFVFTICLLIGGRINFDRRYFFYAVSALAFSFDISYLSETNSTYDIGFIGAFSFSSVYAIFLLTIFPIGRVVRSIIDILLSVLILLPIVLKVNVDINWFGNDVLLTVFQTDLKETALFVSESLSWIHVLVLIALMGGGNRAKLQRL